MPTIADVRGAVAQAIAAAQQLPAMPPYVDYSALLASLAAWLEALQGADADVLAAQQVRALLAALAGVLLLVAAQLRSAPAAPA